MASRSEQDIGRTEVGRDAVSRIFALAVGNGLDVGSDARGACIADTTTGLEVRPGEGFEGAMITMGLPFDEGGCNDASWRTRWPVD